MTLPNNKQVEFARKKKFAIVVISPNKKIFIIYIVVFSLDSDIHPSCRAQKASFLAYKPVTIVFPKFSDFVNIFSWESVAKLLEYVKINDQLIDPVDGQQLFYRPIYNKELVELKMIKT